MSPQIKSFYDWFGDLVDKSYLTSKLRSEGPNSFQVDPHYLLVLTLFDMGGMMAPQIVFDHCAQMLKRRKMKVGDF